MPHKSGVGPRTAASRRCAAGNAGQGLNSPLCGGLRAALPFRLWNAVLAAGVAALAGRGGAPEAAAAGEQACGAGPWAILPRAAAGALSQEQEIAIQNCLGCGSCPAVEQERPASRRCDDTPLANVCLICTLMTANEAFAHSTQDMALMMCRSAADDL
ncbi:MAG: hypothetical protein U5N55_09415 [Cypionkella sp.]|nr:hypothetical protein [Cypionkella sp.]